MTDVRPTSGRPGNPKTLNSISTASSNMRNGIVTNNGWTLLINLGNAVLAIPYIYYLVLLLSLVFLYGLKAFYVPSFTLLFSLCVLMLIFAYLIVAKVCKKGPCSKTTFISYVTYSLVTAISNGLIYFQYFVPDNNQTALIIPLLLIVPYLIVTFVGAIAAIKVK